MYFLLFIFVSNALKFLNGLKCESKGEDNKKKKSWDALPSLQHYEGRHACWRSRMGLRRLTSKQILTQTCTNQKTSWLVHNWSILVDGRATNKQKFTRFTTTWTWGSHHLPPYNIFCAWPWDQQPNVILS
jgi:hypothetical protein